MKYFLIIIFLLAGCQHEMTRAERFRQKEYHDAINKIQLHLLKVRFQEQLKIPE